MAMCTICKRDDLRWFTLYNRTARPRLTNPDGSDHVCYPEPGPDIIECACGQPVYRWHGGRKTDMDGTPHQCKRSAVTTPLQERPLQAPKLQAQPLKRGIDTTILVKG